MMVMWLLLWCEFWFCCVFLWRGGWVDGLEGGDDYFDY